jgi:hypothetical protein
MQNLANPCHEFPESRYLLKNNEIIEKLVVSVRQEHPRVVRNLHQKMDRQQGKYSSSPYSEDCSFATRTQNITIFVPLESRRCKLSRSTKKMPESDIGS